MLDATKFLIDFQDHLAPRLDTYEQVLYLYVIRHSRLVDEAEVVIGFKSARGGMAFGIGKAGSPMSERVCYEKPRSLQEKGFLKLLGTEHGGTRVRVLLPHEIPGLIPEDALASEATLEDMDFFTVPENRLLILKRESNRCFYCLCALGGDNFIVEHVVSRPVGDNGFRNVVAACRQCNNRKGQSTAEDFLRTLYREKLLGRDELEARMSNLERLRAGDVRPELANKPMQADGASRRR